MLFAYNTEQLPQVRMIGRTRYGEPWIHFHRTIHEYVLYVVREGNLYLEENGIPYHLASGDMLLLEPDLEHHGTQASPCDYYYVHFKHPGLAPVKDETAAMTQLKEKRTRSMASYNLDEGDVIDPVTYLPKCYAPVGQVYWKLFHDAIKCYDNREEHYKRAVSTELHRFLLAVSHEHLIAYLGQQGGKRRKSEDTAERILYYLNHNYSKPLCSTQLEEMFEVNFDSVNRVFASMTGTTIFRYLNGLRISNARQLIATTNLSFTEIGYLVGIEDNYYFSRVFKRYTGMSPREYYELSHNKT